MTRTGCLLAQVKALQPSVPDAAAPGSGPRKQRLPADPAQRAVALAGFYLILSVTGAPHLTQSRCFFPIDAAVGQIGGIDRPRAETTFGWSAAAGARAGRATGVISTSNKSFGVHSSAVHNAARVDSFTWAGSLVNSADTDAADNSSLAFPPAGAAAGWPRISTARVAAIADAARDRRRLRF